MGWLDKLEDHGKSAVRERRKPLPRPPVQEVIVTVRRSKVSGPGEVTIGYFTMVGDMADEPGRGALG